MAGRFTGQSVRYAPVQQDFAFEQQAPRRRSGKHEHGVNRQSSHPLLVSPRSWIWNDEDHASVQRQPSHQGSMSQAYEDAAVCHRQSNSILVEELLHSDKVGLRIAALWNLLEPEEKECLVRNTADVPFDTQSMAGIGKMHKTLMQGQAHHRTLHFLFVWFLMVLNLYTVGKSFEVVWRSPVEFGGYYGKVLLDEDTLKLCSPICTAGNTNGGNLTGNNATGDNITDDCGTALPFAKRIFEEVRTHLKQPSQIGFPSLNSLDGDNVVCESHPVRRLQAFRYLCTVEFVSIVFLAITVILASVRFLSLARTSSEGLEFVSSRAFILVLLPRLTSRFSLFKGIVFLNVSSALRSLRRGDYILYLMLLYVSLCPCARRTELLSARRGLFFCIIKVIIAVFMASAALAAVQMLLVKITALFFVITSSVDTWGVHRCLLLLGFVNQIAGIYDSNLLEFNSILLMKFAGEDCTWYQKGEATEMTKGDSRELEHVSHSRSWCEHGCHQRYTHQWLDVHQFLALGAKSLCLGKSIAWCPSFGVLVCLGTIGPFDLLQLFFDKHREDKHCDMSTERYKVCDIAYTDMDWGQFEDPQYRAARVRPMLEEEQRRLADLQDRLRRDLQGLDACQMPPNDSRAEKYRLLALSREQLFNFSKAHTPEGPYVDDFNFVPTSESSYVDDFNFVRSDSEKSDQDAESADGGCRSWCQRQDFSLCVQEDLEY